MKAFSLITLLSGVLLWADTPFLSVDDLIDKAFKNNPSIKQIKQKIKETNSQIKLSSLWQNPKLSIKVSDIQFDDPINRTIEPMQFSSITYTQTIPYYGKTKQKEKIQKKKKILIKSSLENLKVQMAKEIKILSVNIWYIEHLIKIIKDTINIAKQDISLHESYSSLQSKHHIGIMSAQMELSNLKLQKSDLIKNKEQLYSKLSYWYSEEITQLNFNYKIDFIPLLSSYIAKENKIIKQACERLEIDKAKIKLAQLNKNPDPSVSLGYFYRGGYNDYVSISYSTSLPIYKKEHLLKKIEKRNYISDKFDLLNKKNKIKAEIKEAYFKLKNAYEKNHIIKQENLAQIDHMFDINDADFQNSNSLFNRFILLKQKLKFESLQLQTVKEFYTQKAILSALTGKIK
jgi:outer membrane protein TolC